ncbi:putative transcription factor GRAS family [Helianthus annuus]|nr:putative transcription factor GRAS family [Helianthus annuus]
MDGRLGADSGLSNQNTTKCNKCDSILADQNVPNATSFDESMITDCNLNGGSDFSNLGLKYINQMLMEEDIDEKNCMFRESAALQAAEKSLYNVLMVQDQDLNAEETLCNVSSVQSRDLAAESTDLTYDISESSFLPTSFESQSRFYPSYSLFSSASNIVDGFSGAPEQFQNGIDEASRVLPNGVQKEKTHESSFIPNESIGKKNPYSEDLVEAERNSKQRAVYSEPDVSVRSKMFDDVLLCDGPKTHPFQCDFVCKEIGNKGQPDKPKGSNVVKACEKKQKEVADLRTLLSLCAQSVSINDQRGVTDLLKRIREHASPTGDAMQRLAHYFSAGLEARMAGSGTGIYKKLLSIPTSAVDVLKTYRLFLGCFPFTKISHFVSNKTIMSVAQNKTKLHIIDFGILHGFQWPCLIQKLSTRPNGPPELRITGIDFPCPGFRPTQRVEETGRRLANYAETFGVGFKFKAIAQKWETITIEDLELDDDETLVVNCGYKFRNLLDESVMVDSPRNKVLDLIRKMNPKIFIHGIVNSSYGVPFFLTRFREALFFFSSLFDMLDATVDCLTEERMLVEKTMWGREAMNVIACEGGERIERPEAYKQWQVRNQRAGFRQVAFDRKILRKAKDRGTSDYHKDFIIDEDGKWMLQGWKGRMLYAISAWKPACC